MYCGKRRNGQKTPRTKFSRQKNPGHTPHEGVCPVCPSRTKTRPPVKTYVCLHVLLKTGWSEMCDVQSRTLLWRCVTKCDRGKGASKLVQNSVTYLMDGTQALLGGCVKIGPK